MPKTYSIELRQKVLHFYQDTQHKSKTCKFFDISRTTLDDWIFLQEKTGQLKQPKSQHVGRPACIQDLTAFQYFVETTTFSQIKELVPLFESQFGYAVSYQVLLNALHRLGWIHKQKAFYKP